MNRSSIQTGIFFQTFWYLLPLYFNPLSPGQCDENKREKSPQKFKKLNTHLNRGAVQCQSQPL